MIIKDKKYYYGVFGQRIAFLRKKKNLSQSDLSRELGFKSTGTVAIWETGRNGTSFYNLIKLSILFGVSVDWLLGLEPLSQDDDHDS